MLMNLLLLMVMTVFYVRYIGGFEYIRRGRDRGIFSYFVHHWVTGFLRLDNRLWVHSSSC